MRTVALLALMGLSCSPVEDDVTTDPGGWAPDLFCPGQGVLDCASAGGALRVGVAVRSVVPACYETFDDEDSDVIFDNGSEDFHDCGCDQLCPGDDGYPGPDEGEGDATFQAAWIGGFSNARAAQGVRGADQGMVGEGDGLDARVIVLDQGDTRVALVTLDAVGWMHDQALDFRQAVLDAGLDVDHLVVHSSHSHSAPDTMGIYGPSLTKTGYRPDYADQVRAAIVEATTEAVDGLTEASMSWGSVDSNAHDTDGVGNLIRDSRDPAIVDPRVGAIRFADASDETIATLVHWANHPETIGGRNSLMSSGFVHATRKTVSEGSSWPDDSGREGIGGVTLYLNGTVGGMMTSLGASVTDPTGAEWDPDSWEKTDAVGQIVGELALDALEAATPADDPSLRFATQTLFLPVDNIAFRAMFSLGVLDHRTTHMWDPDAPITDDNLPFARTEVGVLELGPLRLLQVPGELFPEAAIGGYDGAFTPPDVDIVDPGNSNPPDLSTAPEGPYLLDRLGGELPWVLGLANDEIGYIIPPWNWEVSSAAYLAEAEGDHYEETNSLGPSTLPLMVEEMERVIDWMAGVEVE